MKDKLLKLTQKITTWHEKLFAYLIIKSKESSSVFYELHVFIKDF